MSVVASQIHCKTASEVRNVFTSFLDRLEKGEKLTGTPTVTVSPTGPTIANIAIPTADRIINGKLVPGSASVSFTVSAGTAGTQYTFTLTATTNAANAQTLIGKIRLEVIAD